VNPTLRVRGLVKRFAGDNRKTQQRPAVDGVDLTVESGEFFTLLGPSGCGKTTTLRCVAGLETPDAGEITIGDAVVHGPRVHVPIHQRDIAMVFQSYAIWPHMSVRQNVAFPLRAARVPKDEIARRVQDALRMVHLEDFGDRPATALSGGQQQRVAFARAVVRGSDLLLLDEPLSNLDAKLRLQMRDELRSLQQQLKITTIFVTHDQEEALSLSDRIAVMRDGKVLEIGRPEQLYLEPTHSFTAQFIGQAQLWPVERLTSGAVQAPFGVLEIDERDRLPAGPVSLLVRPEHLRLHPAGSAPTGRNVVPARIRSVAFSGKFDDVDVVVGDQVVHVQTLAGSPFRAGDDVLLQFPPQRCRLVAGEPRAGAEPVAVA
jgi:iron(III) transport system ATP-binding protein